MGPDAPEQIPLVALDKYCTKMLAVPALDPKQCENRYVLLDLASMYNDRLCTKVNVLPVREWMQKAKALGMPAGVEASWTGNEVFVSPMLRKGCK
ncbi:Male sterility NAD-binding [Penicillium hordei]|uniref:Male sterility NAD-binding n=1 Tax=Penicillium hordei TaxID=40994 RepID=A0AAD6E5F6_9EURO|nr:Male sterility NAD-binding [Penicillium hordei]KAJ5602399.1 Male sterility NAD-binding [Penicillium hordei]